MNNLYRHSYASLLRMWNTPVALIRPRAARHLLKLGARIYLCALRRDQYCKLSRRRALPAWVVSIGNITAGGTGKTPFTMWLSDFLRARGYPHAILSRGYGRYGKSARRVPAEGETRRLVRKMGDEPVLLARRSPAVPVWVGPERWITGKAALDESKAKLLVLDDGFQHLQLVRNLDIILLDALNPFGNASLIPLGPLREPIEHLRRADAVILTRADCLAQTHEIRAHLDELLPGKPVFSCRHKMAGFGVGLEGCTIPVSEVAGKSVVAFAGLANNQSFFESLGNADIHVAAQVAYPDHHLYTHKDAACLLELFRSRNAQYLVTTAKDAVRLPTGIQSVILTSHIQLDFGEELEDLIRFLEERLPHPPALPISSVASED